VRLPVQSSLGWHYVPYERTYRGVPVIGGDFVVVVDPAGRVSSTSVAQRSVIRGLDVRPAVSRVAAEGKASASPAVAGSARSTRLVVEARDDAPRLAWESVLPAADGPGTRTVEVDAVAGGVVRSRDDVLHDVGHAGLNGGNVSVPSALINCPEPGKLPDQHTWILAYPAGGGLNCNAPSVHRTDPEPLEWGDGDPTHVETACVDAMYVAGRENDMVRDWLGRNSLRGTGINDGFPMSTNSTVLRPTPSARSAVTSRSAVERTGCGTPPSTSSGTRTVTVSTTTLRATSPRWHRGVHRRRVRRRHRVVRQPAGAV
jgi:Zn-dependent metalloprotease